MLKNLLRLFVVSVFSVSSCWAAATMISVLPQSAEVQCNNWGWVKGPIKTWANSCAPLQVKFNDKVYSISNSARKCDDKLASFQFIFGFFQPEKCVSMSPDVKKKM